MFSIVFILFSQGIFLQTLISIIKTDCHILHTNLCIAMQKLLSINAENTIIEVYVFCHAVPCSHHSHQYDFFIHTKPLCCLRFSPDRWWSNMVFPNKLFWMLMLSLFSTSSVFCFPIISAYSMVFMLLLFLIVFFPILVFKHLWWPASYSDIIV